MIQVPGDDDLLERGAWGEVRYAVRQNGAREARVWMKSTSTKVKSKFDHLFRKMAETGRIFNQQHFRVLRDNIYEFKRDGDRVLCFQVGHNWYLTHHFKKGGSAKCPVSEIERAKAIRAEHMGIKQIPGR